MEIWQKEVQRWVLKTDLDIHIRLKKGWQSSMPCLQRKLSEEKVGKTRRIPLCIFRILA